MKCKIDFVPSEDLLQLQKVELKIFKEFKRVCEKYKIKYCAEGGTLIGAARHNGFIPWDDDIDVLMKWEDFILFKKVASKELVYPFILQDYTNDVFFDISPMARIRNSQTTGCTKWELENVQSTSYNRGIFIDIFVVFPVPEEKYREERKQQIEHYWRAIRGWYAEQNEMRGKLSSYKQYLPYWKEVSHNYTISDLKNKYIEYCNWEGEYNEIGMTSFRTYNPKYMWRKSILDEYVELPFEDTTISCPKDYSEFLTHEFGEWRIPVFEGAYHEMVVCDVKTPYYEKEEFQLI